MQGCRINKLIAANKISGVSVVPASEVVHAGRLRSMFQAFTVLPTVEQEEQEGLAGF
jgi:hypothetical protein